MLSSSMHVLKRTVTELWFSATYYCHVSKQQAKRFASAYHRIDDLEQQNPKAHEKKIVCAYRSYKEISCFWD
jgi:hypothetical protein